MNCRVVVSCLCILASIATSSFGGIKVTGSPDDKTTFATMLTAIMGTTVTIAGDGTLSIAAGGNGCATLLRDALTDTTAVKLALGRNLPKVLAGGFNETPATGVTTGTQSIDLNDIEKLGNDNTAGIYTRGSVIMHEIWEVIYSRKNKTTFGAAHEHAILHCENGYYAAMTGTPTIRVCGLDETKDHGDYFTKYERFKKGDGTVGWCCITYEIVGTNGYELTGAPTFVPGEAVPEAPGVRNVEAATIPDILPGPTDGFPCAVEVPTTSPLGAVVLATLLIGAGVFLLRRVS